MVGAFVHSCRKRVASVADLTRRVLKFNDALTGSDRIHTETSSFEMGRQGAFEAGWPMVLSLPSPGASHGSRRAGAPVGSGLERDGPKAWRVKVRAESGCLCLRDWCGIGGKTQVLSMIEHRAAGL